MWRLIAWIVSRPRVADWLIKRAMKTPYTHIYHPQGLYMGRWWLFNPYPADGESGKKNRFPISIRIHHICLPDEARDLHDHPWNARTIILKGGYIERRLEGGVVNWYDREAGATAKINFGEFHTIDELYEGGAWTLFITGKYRGTWGFLVNGVKVQWRKYTGYKS
jgi:hypothetical protein